MKRILNIENKKIEFEILEKNNSFIKIKLDDKEYELDLNKKISSLIFDLADKKQVFINSQEVLATLRPKVESSKNNSTVNQNALVSPMPGKIFKLLCKKGDKVKKGDSVMILEAMKMEHTLFANKDGVIKKFYFAEGDLVPGNELLCELGEAN